jgi:hypothetical protein
MTNLIDLNYNQTRKSKSTNEFGMGEVQAKTYAQYLLLKVSPALDKFQNVIQKVISCENSNVKAISHFRHVEKMAQRNWK